MLFAQLVRGWSLAELLIAVIVIGACVGIVWVALRQFGVTVPAWAVTIFWIVVVACVAVLAIRFVMSL